MPYPLGHWVTTQTSLSQRPLTRCHHHAPPRAPRPRAGRCAVDAAPTAAARAPAPRCPLGLGFGPSRGACAWLSTPRFLPVRWVFLGVFFPVGAHSSHLGNFKQNSTGCASPTLILFTWAGPGVCIPQSSPGPSLPSAAHFTLPTSGRPSLPSRSFLRLFKEHSPNKLLCAVDCWGIPRQTGFPLNPALLPHDATFIFLLLSSGLKGKWRGF